ncbi:MAG: RICIN domain-containing protein [Pleurocapsa sp. MO_226.B13]|nr:RICIN domain-containing protein [Pleurocapsa sp. MO_226.B13]
MIEINKAIAFSIVAVGAILGLNNRAAFARPEYFYIRARHSGQCLNVLDSGQDNGDNVVQGEECRSSNFQWAIIPADRGYYYLRARHSGQCLNVLDSGQDNGDNVVQGEECRSSNFQWAIIPVRDSRSRNYDRNYNYRRQEYYRDRYRYKKYERIER